MLLQIEEVFVYGGAVGVFGKYLLVFFVKYILRDVFKIFLEQLEEGRHGENFFISAAELQETGGWLTRGGNCQRLTGPARALGPTTLRRTLIRVTDGFYIFGLEDAVEVEAAGAADVHYLVFVQIAKVFWSGSRFVGFGAL